MVGGLFLCFATYLTVLVKASSVINVVEVKTPSGWVRGYEENYAQGQVYRFIKVPFAQPPVGDLRFQKPMPIGEWSDVRGTREVNSPQCPQIENPIPGFDRLEDNEDCLYLNIYVPGKVSKENKLPVMVWYHGGGFICGGASQYKPQKMVLEGQVIVITVNYRLGLFGFLTLHDPLAPGNYGLRDQIEALRWIQNNIAAFGGDPKSVTIFGESAGGMSVSLQTLIPSNEGLFQRAISQSGVVSYYSHANKKEEEQTNELLLKRTGCDGRESIAETMKCLRDLPAKNITEAISMYDFVKPLNVSVQVGSLVPTVDGELVKENFAFPKRWDNEAYRFFRSIDFMSGTLDGEGNLAYLLMSPELQEKLEFNVSQSIPKIALCNVLAPSFVESFIGNIPSLTQEICDFYTTDEGTDEQSNKVCEFLGDTWFIIPSNFMLSIHAKNNDRFRTFQYLVTQPTPFSIIPLDPPSWFKGAGHGEEIHLLFNMSRDHVPEEKLKNVDIPALDKFSSDVIKYWTNFAKFG